MTVDGDYFVFALPVEDVIDLITPEMVKADPALGSLFTLDDITEWMNGIQIYLKEDVPIRARAQHLHRFAVGAHLDLPGPVLEPAQPVRLRRRHGAGHHLGRHLGVGRAGPVRQGGQGLHAGRDQDRGVGAAQEKRELRRRGDPQGRAAPQLEPRSEHAATRHGTIANEEPLLVNLVDTWKLRPEAVSRIPNLFLASDYVRTFTDLATMEAANEAARRAVNGILDAERVRRPRAACGSCTSRRSSRRGASSTSSATRRACRGTTRSCASGCRCRR